MYLPEKMEPRIEDINRLDAAAFRQLYRIYYKALVYHGWQITESREAAEDIVQELFSTIWERQMQFQSLPAFRSYLYSAVRNAALNYLKHQDVESSYMSKMAEKLQEEELSEGEEEPFEEDEVYRLLFDTVDKLPTRCREVFLLYMKGKKNEEIAEALQVSVETVKTQKKRAMQTLRKNMGIFSFILIEQILH